MICDKCNGLGYIEKIFDESKNDIEKRTQKNIEMYPRIYGYYMIDDKIVSACDKCLGKEDIDWLENVIGVEDEFSKWCKLFRNM